MLDTTNQLHGTYQNYQCRQVQEACQEIPVSQRQGLREVILARATIIGCTNPKALQTALKHL